MGFDKCKVNGISEIGSLNSFQCFDGRIIQMSQVCNGIIDCKDLSDECLCENTKVESLCKLVFSISFIKNSKFTFDKLCDFKYDLREGLDEVFCDNRIFLMDTKNKFKETDLNTCQCATGFNTFLQPKTLIDQSTTILATVPLKTTCVLILLYRVVLTKVFLVNI